MVAGPEGVEDGSAIVGEQVGVVALMGRRPRPWCVGWHLYMLATRRSREGEDSVGLKRGMRGSRHRRVSRGERGASPPCRAFHHGS